MQAPIKKVDLNLTTGDLSTDCALCASCGGAYETLAGVLPGGRYQGLGYKCDGNQLGPSAQVKQGYLCCRNWEPPANVLCASCGGDWLYNTGILPGGKYQGLGYKCDTSNGQQMGPPADVSKAYLCSHGPDKKGPTCAMCATCGGHYNVMAGVTPGGKYRGLGLNCAGDALGPEATVDKGYL